MPVDSLTLDPIKSFKGHVTLPGSKSLSNRILLLAAMSEGVTKVTNLLFSDDTRHMLRALKELSVDVVVDEVEKTAEVRGLAAGFGKNNEKDITLFLGNAGTAARPLAAALCLSHSHAGSYRLEGEPRMYERPIGPLMEALTGLGARFTYLKEEGYLPLDIRCPSFDKGAKEEKIFLDGSLSSQYVTAILMALPLLKRPVVLCLTGDLVSLPYIDITLNVMARFSVELERRDARTFYFDGKQSYQSPKQILVEGDASSASYFLAAAGLGGGPVRVRGLSKESVQGDVRFVEVLEKVGLKIGFGPDYIEAAGSGSLKGVDLDLNHIPDAAMTLCTLALFAEGKTTIRNVYNWRLKETDRLKAMAIELAKVGAKVEEGEDYITIDPPAKLTSAAIATYNDHRMAMCFSLAAFGDGVITILDPGCTSKTYPEYFKEFKRMSGF